MTSVMFPTLFSPFRVRGMELKNRVILPAMGSKMASKDRQVTEKLIDYHVRRVEGGSGLNIVEVCSVHTPSAPRGFLSISEESYIPGHKKLVDGIHQAGGKAGIQLWQGGLVVSKDKECQILLPCDMPLSPQYTVPGLTVEQIREVAESFGRAAARCVAAGYDCVEFHCAHNYLAHMFLSPAFNRRTDEYGGSPENQMRFPLECIRAIRENIPEDMPLFMRVDAMDDYLDHGMTLEYVVEFCKQAGEAGVDVLDISRGNVMSAGLKFEVPPIDLPQGFNVENAARIHAETGMITAAVGRINHPQMAEEILREGKAELVVMGRAQLADPDFCKKAACGELEDIVYCVGCDQGCYDTQLDPDAPTITCMRNPAIGKEREYELITASVSRSVLVAGCGMGGLEAAVTLKMRGHRPVICEASSEPGGQFVLAGVAPRKEEMKDAVLAQVGRAERMGIEIRLDTPVTPELIEEMKPEAVVLAIGAEPLIPKLEGTGRENVFNSHDVLRGKARPEGRVGVIGGGLVGLEVAEYLAAKGHQVTVVEMLPKVASDMGDVRRICVMEEIEKAQIKTVVGAKCTRITGEGIVAMLNREEITIPCDSVVIAVGAVPRPTRHLTDACEKLSIPCYVIGDAVKARRALNAVAEAAEAARKI